MTRVQNALATLADHACRAARSAGALIAASVPAQISTKPGGDSLAAQVVTDVDKRAERRILAELADSIAEFDLAVLSEETPDDKRRLTATHFWSIDPLDGTLPFIEGTAGYAVSIALVARDGAPLIGVVVDPARNVLYRAVAGHGYSRQPPLDSPPLPGDRLIVLADRSFEADPERGRNTERLDAVAARCGLTGIDLRVGAGAVINACSVLETPPACYVKLPKPGRGGGSLWDFAATACLFREAGAVATDIAGGPLDLNRGGSTFMSHRGVIFATDEPLATRIREAFNVPLLG